MDGTGLHGGCLYGPCQFCIYVRVKNTQEHLTSAMTVSHEIGHLLGVQHDGELPDALACNTEEGHIMERHLSPGMFVKLMNDNQWSSCSREQLMFK